MGPIKILRNQKGIALILAMFSIMLMLFIAVEISHESTVEYIIANQNVQRLKAYYAARAGVEISILRVQLFKKVYAQYATTLGDKAGVLEMIWKFPLAWPPPAPPNADAIEKDAAENIRKSSFIDGQFATFIEPEGGRIDLNDLASPHKVLAERTAVQLLTIFERKLESDEDFGRKHRGENFGKLINNIADWVDADTESRNGGDESAQYGAFDNKGLPPNRPFQDFSEIHMVAGMTDEFYQVLEPSITIFGTKGVNINYANGDLLKAAEPVFTDEQLMKAIEEYRSNPMNGPFKTEEEFKSFLNKTVGSEGFNQEKYPFVIDADYNFRIRSVGYYGKAEREIQAIVYDYEGIKQRFVKLMKEQKKAENPSEENNPNPNPNPDPNNPNPDPNNPNPNPNNPNPGNNEKKEEKEEARPVPKGKPLIVYWYEK